MDGWRDTFIGRIGSGKKIIHHIQIRERLEGVQGGKSVRIDIDIDIDIGGRGKETKRQETKRKEKEGKETENKNKEVVPITTDNAKFDFTKVNWLGSVAVRPYVGVVWHTTEADTIEKMRDTEVIFGSSGVGGSSYQYPVFVSKISGAKMKLIPGYKSGGAMNLAMESGEINGRGNYYEGFLATNPDWVRDNKIKYVFRMGDDHPDLMNVPQASDYATNEADKKMLAFLEAPLKVGQAFYVHENVPADRLVALKKAFTDMLNDPKFLEDAKKMGLVIRTRTADQVAKVVNDLYATPRNLISDLDAIFKQ